MSNVTFRVAMPEPHRHLYEVAVTVKKPSASTRFRMPVWTPGSYLVREFSRHVQDVTAVGDNGESLHVEKRDKACWEVRAENMSSITLQYRVYAYDLTVRTSHLDGTHGYFNGANVFACPEGHEHEPLQLEVVPPDGWMVSVALPRVPSDEGGAETFWAVDFDELGIRNKCRDFTTTLWRQYAIQFTRDHQGRNLNRSKLGTRVEVTKAFN